MTPPTTAKLAFEGFAQVRLATDPDPADEPRGVGGWTHAAAGEPDLDRVIVLQDDDPRRVRRSHGPAVGVTVTGVALGGTPAPQHHPLIGARFELTGDPKFEGRNWIIAADGREPIDPMRLRITSGDLALEKQDVVDDPAAGLPLPFYRLTPAAMTRRMPKLENAPAAVAEIFTALGVPAAGPVAWRTARRELLEQDLAALDATGRPDAAAALRLRIADLQAMGPAVGTVGVRMRYRIDLHGPGRASLPAEVFGGDVDESADWPIDFWVGGWDADALCMYLRGSLSVPLRSPGG